MGKKNPPKPLLDEIPGFWSQRKISQISFVYFYESLMKLPAPIYMYLYCFPFFVYIYRKS